MDRESLQNATRNLREQAIKAAQAAAREMDGEPENPQEDRDQMDAVVGRAKEAMGSIERAIESALWCRDDNEAVFVTSLLESAYTMVQTARQIAGTRIARNETLVARDKAQADYEAAEEAESEADDAVDDAKMDQAKAVVVREDAWRRLQEARQRAEEAKEAFGE